MTELHYTNIARSVTPVVTSGNAYNLTDNLIQAQWKSTDNSVNYITFSFSGSTTVKSFWVFNTNNSSITIESSIDNFATYDSTSMTAVTYKSLRYNESMGMTETVNYNCFHLVSQKSFNQVRFKFNNSIDTIHTCGEIYLFTNKYTFAKNYSRVTTSEPVNATISTTLNGNIIGSRFSNAVKTNYSISGAELDQVGHLVEASMNPTSIYIPNGIYTDMSLCQVSLSSVSTVTDIYRDIAFSVSKKQ